MLRELALAPARYLLADDAEVNDPGCAIARRLAERVAPSNPPAL